MSKKQGFASFNPDKLREVSSKGGKKTTAQGGKPKGFAALSPERRRELAAMGGKKSKRIKKEKNDDRTEEFETES